MFGLSKRVLTVVAVLVGVAILLIIQNGKKSDAAPASSTTGGCQMQVTADVLNVRSAPDGTSSVVTKLSTGAVIGATTNVQKGYRELSTDHWAADKFLKQVSGNC